MELDLYRSSALQLSAWRGLNPCYYGIRLILLIVIGLCWNIVVLILVIMELDLY